MQSWQAALAVFATILIATSSCDSADCEGEHALINTDECSYYYDLLEKALLNDSNNVYRLQQTFFPLNRLTPTEVNFYVVITIGGGNDNSCSDVMLDKSGAQTYVYGAYFDYFEWVSREGRFDEFTIQPIIFGPTISLGLAMAQIAYQNQFRSFVNIDLKVESLPCNPRWDTTHDTLARLFTWAKAYARACGKPRKLDKSDRGLVYTLGNYDTFPYSKAIPRLLLAGFIFLNVLVMLLLVNFVPSYYQKLFRKVNSDVNSNIYHSFYWGCALVCYTLSMALHLLDLMMYAPVCYFSGICSTELGKVYLVSSISTKLAVAVVELLVCAFVCKRNAITLHTPFRKCTTNVLFCCCCCCCCSSTRKSKVVQTLALWGIMAFVQHITAGLIPACIAIISRPAEVLSILALIASALFCIIMFVVHLLHQGRVSGCQQTAAFCTRVFSIVLFIGLAVVLVTLYLIFLAAGMELSLGGLLGSLVPSVILSAVGWYVKTRLLKKKTADQHQDAEAVVVHRNAPDWNSESDGEQTPLFRNIN